MDKKDEYKKAQAKHHESYVSLTVLAVIIPIAALIVGLIYLTKDRAVDKKLGEHVVAISILMMVVQGALWAIFVAIGSANTSIYG